MKNRVLVYGDVMLDVSVFRSTYPTTQEDHTVPIYPKYDLSQDVCVAGGAGNLAANLATLGCDVTLACHPAGDAEWVAVEAHLKSLGVKFYYLDTVLRTTVKCRYYVGDRLVARVDDNYKVTSVDKVNVARDLSNQFDAVVITDYGKGSIETVEDAHFWASLCPKKFADPKKGRTSLWADVKLTTFVMNWEEASGSFKYDGSNFDKRISSDVDAGKLADRVAAAYSANSVIVKRGKYGSTLTWANHGSSGNRTGLPVTIPPFIVNHARDVQGAGDTYLAGYVCADLRGLSTAEACAFASAAAGVAVSKAGTATVTLDEVTTVVAPYFVGSDKEAAVYSNGSLNALARYVMKCQAIGLTVGYTNGCFDARLHAGHRFTIGQSAKGCDVLIVGVDSDARVRKLKGDTRPIHGEWERALAIASLRGVHAVLIFDLDPAEILAALKPDFLFKGGDYVRETMPEISASGWAGTFVNIGTVVCEQTTTFIERIKEEAQPCDRLSPTQLLTPTFPNAPVEDPGSMSQKFAETPSTH